MLLNENGIVSAYAILFDFVSNFQVTIDRADINVHFK